MRKSDGFTLVELLVGILCASIVTGAAMVLMLMGARTNRALWDTNSEQQTARIITTMIESLASEGDIHKIELHEDNNSYIGWDLLDSEGNTILAYSDQEIRTPDGTPLMKGVVSSSLALSKSDMSGSLLKLSIQTESNSYQTAIYSRCATIISDISLTPDGSSAEITVGTPLSPESAPTTEIIEPDTSEHPGRFKLLEILCSQYESTGKIMGTPDPSGYEYYSEWYIKDLNYEDSGWSETTPWCACFVSWGIAQITNDYLNSSLTPIRFAHVESGAKIFKDLHLWQDPASYLPSAGDLVFFDFYDWDNDPGDAAPSSLDHVGVVFYCDNNYLYTIEGNTSADSNGVGRVDLKRYALNDTNIIGYGVLNWK